MWYTFRSSQLPTIIVRPRQMRLAFRFIETAFAALNVKLVFANAEGYGLISTCPTSSPELPLGGVEKPVASRRRQAAIYAHWQSSRATFTIRYIFMLLLLRLSIRAADYHPQICCYSPQDLFHHPAVQFFRALRLTGFADIAILSQYQSNAKYRGLYTYIQGVS